MIACVMNAQTPAAAHILESRNALISELVARALDGPDGAAVKKLEEAFKLLTGTEPPAWEVSISHETSVVVPPAPTPPVATRAPVTKRRGPAVKKLLLDIMRDEADRGRVWTYDEMLNAFRARGRDLSDLKDPKATLRTAVWSLATNGDAIERVDEGGFRLAPARFEHLFQGGG